MFDVPVNDESTFASDWNLFSLDTGATMGKWGGQAVATFLDWRFNTGYDIHGTDVDPQFTDAAHRNYLLAAGSPAIDRGDPTSAFGNEPGNNGGRINLGFEGNTAQATQSPAQTVEVLSPNGLDKLIEGQPTTITWQSSGVAAENEVVAYNTGGNAVQGPQPWSNWTADPGANYTSEGATVNTAGVAFAAPAAVYADSKSAASGVGNELKEVVQVADGTYTVRLDFAEYPDRTRYGYARSFDIKINGQIVTPNFDPLVAAGNVINKAVVMSYTVNVTGGQGITIELVNKTSAPATLAGFQISRQNPNPASTATVEVSPDNGATWQLINANAPVDAFGFGSITWTPNFLTNGNTALIRVTMNGVSDTSDKPFLIGNSGHDYYINDASTVGDEITTAVGDNLNSGKSPDQPLASLEALLSSYTLGAGDVVHVDTGHYIVLTDLVVGPTASGTGDAQSQRVTFQGPTGTGDEAILDRVDTYGGTIFRFENGHYVTLSNLTMTGAYDAVTLPDATSSGISILNSSLHDNSYEGVYAYGYPATATINLKIDHSRLFNNVNADIELEWVNGATITNNELFASKYGIYLGSNLVNEVIDSNSVHDNSIGGIAALGSTGPTSVEVTNNRVFNNSPATNGYGISASGSVTRVAGNTVTGQTDSGADGIQATFGAVVDGNVVSGNNVGIGVRDAGTTIKNNRVFANTTNGIELDGYGAMVITDNRIYSNNKGIFSSFGDVASEQITGNLIYANTGGAIDLSYRTGSRIIGNTIYQSVGNAINLANTATGTTIEDNIIWVDVGNILNVAANSVTGLVADYNLYYRGASGTANAAVLGTTTYANLAAWQAGQSTQNQHSLEGDPKFINIKGADNVLGGPDAAIGGGADDDFTPGKFSPAIDAANASVPGATDLFGQPRHDDPAVANTGTGVVLSIGSYSESDLSSSLYANNGTAILHGWSGAATFPVSYQLPFAFTLGNDTVQTVRLSSAGYIELDPNASFAAAGSPSVAVLEAGIKIAPFWSNVDAVTGSDNIYVDTSKSGQVTFTWIVRKSGAPATSDFSATLFADGSIRFDYGPNLNGLTPVIGVSSGAGQPFLIASINGNTSLTNAHSITIVPGNVVRQNFDDIGAIEFQGSSSDVTAPTVVSGSNLPAEGASTDAAFTSIALNFSEPLDPSSATSALNYQLVEAGADGKFDTPDDKAIAVSPTYAAGSSTLTVNLVNGALANGNYRLTASPNNGILDTAGNPLDGDGNGSSGGAFVRTFHIDRSMDHPPVVADATLATSAGTSLPVTLTATSPDNDPLTFGIVTQPKHGTIQNFDPIAGTFTYVPNSGFTGSDAIGFYAQDNKLGYAAASLAINVTAVNQAPVAYAQNVAALSGQAVQIVLQGYDLETPANQLTLVIMTQPAHGTLQITGQNIVTYTSNTPYSGADHFAYAWKDTGAPAGTPANALTSASATVSISVAAVNHPPVTQNATVTTIENTAYVFRFADFPFSDPNDQPANTLLNVIVTSLPTAGTLTLGGSIVSFGQTIAASDITSGKLVFTPAANAFGATYATFGFAVEDNGGTANNALDTSGTAIMTVAVSRVNSAPTTHDAGVSTLENTAYVFKLADFPFADPNDQPADPLANVIVTSLPGAGSLTFHGSVVSAGQKILAIDITAGKLVFTPGANGVSATYATFGFEVEDNGGTTNSGADTSTAATMTVAVTPVNHAPTTQNATITTPENTAYVFKLSDFPFADASDQPANALLKVIVTSVPGAGSLTFDGAAVLAGEKIAATDISGGNLVFTPATNGIGAAYATFGFEVEDDGGTVNGGADTSTAATMTVAVTPVNQSPVLSNVATSISGNPSTGITLSPNLTVSDPDGLTLASATVAVTGGFADDGDTLSAVVSGTGIAASYDAASETLVLSGVDSLANYQQVLRSVTFDATGLDPSNGGANPGRTVSWVANDGGAVSNQSTPQFTTLGLFSVVTGGETIVVSAGQTVSDVVVTQGGELDVMSGGVVNDVIVVYGGVETINSGGSADGTTISSGGTQYDAGTANGTILSGGTQQVFGNADDTTIGSGGVQEVVSGASATDTTVSSGGAQYVAGTASGTTLSGGTQQVFGSADDTTIDGGGVQQVVSGASVTSTTVSGGGAQYVAGTASGTTLSGGTQQVFGSADDTTIGDGGVQEVVSGASVTGTTVSSGGAQYDAGTASGTTLLGGTQAVFGSAADTTLVSGGNQQVMSGGTASGTTVSSGGTQYDAGTASNTTLSGGTQVVFGGAASTTIDSGGIQDVVSGATASGTTVSSGGFQYVAGTASGTTLLGGTVEVFSGGTINGATISGGLLELLSGATAGSSTITFAVGGGTLKLDGTGTYNLRVAGFAVSDAFDVSEITFPTATQQYSGNASSGTLTVNDGTNSVSLLLLGNYGSASFTLGAESGGAPPVPVVTGLPGAGALGGSAVTAGQKVAATDISSGNLVLTLGQDGGGAASRRSSLSPSAKAPLGIVQRWSKHPTGQFRCGST